ncbi:MAG: hypothetical protein AAB116_12085 [Candidatus Poribacteria bacterium]
MNREQAEHREIVSVRLRDLFSVIGLLALTVVSWRVWSYPFLSGIIGTWGDEDFHFGMTSLVSGYLAQYFHGEIPGHMAPSALRYPDAMLILNTLFVNPFFGNQDNSFWHRFPLLIPYLGLVVIVYAVALNILRDFRASLLLSLPIAVCPIMLSLTSEKYLDVGHPFFFFLASFFLYEAIRTSDFRMAILSGLSSGFLSLIRDNSAPTTMLYGGALLLLGFMGSEADLFRKLRNAVVPFLAATVPFVMFYFLKQKTTNIDVDRLRLANVFEQDYILFFRMAVIYLPIPSVLGIFAFFHGTVRHNFAILVIFGSLVAQLMIYGLFQPGWMPWTRNYMMFLGQALFMGLLAIHQLIQFAKKLRPALLAISVFGLGLNVFVGATELGRNRIFHENENRFAYDQLMLFLAENQTEFGNETLYLHVPIEIPTSFEKAVQTANVRFRFWPVYFDEQKVSFNNFMGFEDFIQRLPSDFRYLIYCWRNPQTLSMVINNYPHPQKPSSEQLKNYRVLLEAIDPWSEGRYGLMLLQKI